MKSEKQYRLRNGWKYENYSTDNGGDYPWHGRYFNEKSRCWSPITHMRDGTYWMNTSNIHDYDLIEISPFDDFKVNDPIMVSSDQLLWYRRLFAGISPEGLPQVFANGGNSWTSHGRYSPFLFGRKPTEEELI